MYKIHNCIPASTHIKKSSRLRMKRTRTILANIITSITQNQFQPSSVSSSHRNIGEMTRHNDLFTKLFNRFLLDNNVHFYVERLLAKNMRQVYKQYEHVGALHLENLSIVRHGHSRFPYKFIYLVAYTYSSYI